MAATKEQIVRAYKALDAAEDKAKKAADSKRSDMSKARKALDDAIEAPDATVKDIVEKHAAKKTIKAKASELVSECNSAAKEAKAKLDKLIKDADQWDLFPDETEEE
jgi:predicted  nucleic acid-binding Zn-ribbon protein